MNNKPLYENRYTVTEEMSKEFVYKVMSRRLYIYGLALSAIFIVVAIFYHSNTTFLTIEAFCLIGMVLTMILSPRRTLKQYLAAGQTLSSGKRAETIVSFDEKHIIVREGKQKVTIKYTQLQRLIRLKSVTMLMLSPENGLMIREDGFTLGDYDSFVKFIITKCPKIEKLEK